MSSLSKTSVSILIVKILLVATTPVWAEAVEYDGLIGPCEVVNIGVAADGVVAKVLVDRGSSVARGQVLVELESSLEWAALEKAKAMASFEAEIDLQQTQLAFAKRVNDRVKVLDAISAHEKDQAATEIILAQYRIEKARENHTLAQIELKRTRALFNRRSVRSPISGVVVERFVHPGEYVGSQPLLQVAQIDPLRVEVVVPAQMFRKIKPGMTATVIPELPEFGERTATVTIVDKVIDSASSTFGVRLELPNSEQEMPSGLKCLVRFNITEVAHEGETN
jgi:RND family efflux transporter MFP subunit